jgi:hypothetical protein
MTELDDLFESSARHDQKHPDGWTPGLTFDGTTGTLTTPPTDTNPDWNGLLAGYLPPGWDSSQYEIDPDSIRFTAWDGWGRDDQGDTATSRTQYSFRARVIQRRDAPDIRELISIIRRHKPRNTNVTGANVIDTTTLVVCWSDWQVGKDDNDGTRGTMRRLAEMTGKVEDRIRDLKPSTLLVAALGDLGESCSGHYAQQTYRVELNEREQRTVIRNAAVSALKRWAPKVAEILVLPVGGNHGEVRNDGASFTDFADNRDVAVFEDVALIFAENPDAFGHVKFHVPNSELTQTIQVSDTRIGMLHGHQARKGGTPEQRIEAWWKGQMMGKHPIGDADILLSGHFHHFIAKEISAGRQWFQSPALDGGSEWFTNVQGVANSAGTLTLTVSDRRWGNLALL